MAKKLNPKILRRLVKGTKNSESGIRVRLSEIRRQNPSITLNGAAQLYASRHGFSVMKMLDEEDRASIPTASQVPAVSIATVMNRSTRRGRRSKQLVIILNYQTSNSFGKKHIEEANRAYNCNCYTAAFILCRKIFENLIINEILVKRYPEKKKENRELYYNTSQKRFRDFSEIVDNLYKRRNEFPPTCIKPIERLHSKLRVFIKDANDYTHSWYYICTKKEFDEIGIQEIADLIAKISASI
jgi:hypothetical protein